MGGPTQNKKHISYLQGLIVRCGRPFKVGQGLRPPDGGGPQGSNGLAGHLDQMNQVLVVIAVLWSGSMGGASRRSHPSLTFSTSSRASNREELAAKRSWVD